MSVVALLKKSIEQVTGEIWLAYSGGMDSHVLLHILATQSDLRLRQRLNAIHIDHGLHADSKQWAQHCVKVCASLQIPLTVKTLSLSKNRGESLEALARSARYQLFQELLIDTTASLMTAHHQDDQAETVMLQLLRGCGIKGLAAMPLCAPLGKGTLRRPFLNCTAVELIEYAKSHQLNWLEDPSNALCHFDRNLLRHQVMPLLTKRWPSVSSTITRTAQHCAEANLLLGELAQQDSKLISGSKPDTLSISGLLQLSPARQRNVVRYYLQTRGLSLPSTAQLQRICHDILKASQDANPCVAWADLQARRYRDDLYVISKDQPNLSHYQVKWDGSVPVSLPVGVLQSIPAQGQGIQLKYLSDMVVCFRQGGERCHMQAKPGSHPLNKLMQEWGVPPWQRDKIPLIKIDGQVAAIVGYGVCKPFATPLQHQGWSFELID